jgi:hypothetical protein
MGYSLCAFFLLFSRDSVKGETGSEKIGADGETKEEVTRTEFGKAHQEKVKPGLYVLMPYV